MPVFPHEARALLLALADTTEAPHFDRLAYRARGPIFATLHAPSSSLNLKLTPEEQAAALAEHPTVLAPVAGGWGRMGYTTVDLAAVDEPTLAALAERAWARSRAKGRRHRR